MHAEVETLVHDVAQARNRMLKKLQKLTPGQGTFKPSPERWSVAEVIEHLVRAERNGIHGMWVALEAMRQGEPAWKEAHPDRNKTIEVIAAKTIRPKEQAPAGAMPTQGGPLGYWSASFASNQVLLERLGEELTEAELDEVIYPHYLMGPLTARQRFAFIRWHIDRHLPQVEAVMEDPRFPMKDPENRDNLVEI